MPLLGREPGTHGSATRASTRATRRSPACAVVRLDGGLFFATAEALEERIRALAQEPTRRCAPCVLDMEGVDFVDSQGAATLAEILDFTDSSGVELRLARVKPSVAAVLTEDGLLERIGRGRIHGYVHRAVEAQLTANRAGERARGHVDDAPADGS